MNKVPGLCLHIRRQKKSVWGLLFILKAINDLLEFRKGHEEAQSMLTFPSFSAAMQTENTDLNGRYCDHTNHLCQVQLG